MIVALVGQAIFFVLTGYLGSCHNPLLAVLLITVAQVFKKSEILNINFFNIFTLIFKAAHWLNLPRLYEESKRVLHKNGVLALICYSLPKVHVHNCSKEIDDKIDAEIANVWKFYYHSINKI